MIELKGDMLKDICEYDVICVTTNGFVKRDGSCPMGAGIARDVLNKFPGIDFRLGKCINVSGNIPHIINDNPIIISLPTKPDNFILTDQNSVYPYNKMKNLYGKSCPGFMSQSDIILIRESLNYIKNISDLHFWNKIALTRPGCGNGGLDWDYVKSNIEDLLDDRFFVYSL